MACLLFKCCQNLSASGSDSTFSSLTQSSVSSFRQPKSGLRRDVSDDQERGAIQNLDRSRPRYHSSIGRSKEDIDDLPKENIELLSRDIEAIILSKKQLSKKQKRESRVRRKITFDETRDENHSPVIKRRAKSMSIMRRRERSKSTSEEKQVSFMNPLCAESMKQDKMINQNLSISQGNKPKCSPSSIPYPMPYKPYEKRTLSLIVINQTDFYHQQRNYQRSQSLPRNATINSPDRC